MRPAHVPAGPLVQAKARAVSEYEPTLQLVQAEARTVENVPRSQSEQLTASPTLNLPSSQPLHTSLPYCTPVK